MRAKQSGEEALAQTIRDLIDLAETTLANELADRQLTLEGLLKGLRREVAAILDSPTASVVLFKPGGKYYTTEAWRIPPRVPSEIRPGRMRETTGPYDMEYSPDFHRIDGGAVLVESQEPWGYPFLFPNE
jgi:hypothetical protein